MVPRRWCGKHSSSHFFLHSNSRSQYKSCPHVLTKYIEGTVPGGLTPAHYAYNKQLNSVRQRVEHVIGLIKARAMFRQPWRCSFRNAITYSTIRSTIGTATLTFPTARPTQANK